MEKDFIYSSDLVTIKGKRYIKSAPVFIKQKLLVNKFSNSNIILPGYISGMVVYQDKLFIATEQINDGVKFTNDWDYDAIYYYPESGLIGLNMILQDPPFFTEKELEEMDRARWQPCSSVLDGIPGENTKIEYDGRDFVFSHCVGENILVFTSGNKLFTLEGWRIAIDKNKQLVNCSY